MPLLIFCYYGKIALFRGVCRRSLLAVLQVREKSLDVAFCCLCAVNVNHCVNRAPRGARSFRLFVIFVKCG